MLTSIPENWIACKDCDLLLERVATPPGGTLALAITGLLLFIPANLLPVMSLQLIGQETSTTIYEGSLVLFREGLYWTALLVFSASVVIPLCKLLLMLFVSGYLYLGRSSPLLPYAMRYYHHIDEWGMLEVYMLSVLVAVVKLKGMASVIPDIGLYCFICLLLVTTLMSSLLDHDAVWQQIEHGQGRSPA